MRGEDETTTSPSLLSSASSSLRGVRNWRTATFRRLALSASEIGAISGLGKRQTPNLEPCGSGKEGTLIVLKKLGSWGSFGTLAVFNLPSKSMSYGILSRLAAIARDTVK
jgi:hypothetical protein